MTPATQLIRRERLREKYSTLSSLRGPYSLKYSPTIRGTITLRSGDRSKRPYGEGFSLCVKDPANTDADHWPDPSVWSVSANIGGSPASD